MEAKLAEANDLFVDEQYEDALALYTDCCEMEEAGSSAFAKRGNCYLKLGNREGALQDFTKAAELEPDAPRLLLRKGVCEFELGYYHAALVTFESGHALKPEQFTTWLLKARAMIQLKDSRAESVAVTTATAPQPKPATSPVTGEDISRPKKEIYRHEWFQNADFVFVSILAKKIPKEAVSHEFSATDMSVAIALDSGNSWNLDIDFCEEIVPSESSLTVGQAKIELKLKKKTPLKWETLERSNDPAAIATRSWADTSKVDKHAYPSSSKTKKNWDSLNQEVAQMEKEEKPEGDAALNALFKQIYKDADEDTRRAMNKSFVESGGTVLSTNWKEVGVKKVEGKPPAGMEQKKYEY